MGAIVAEITEKLLVGGDGTPEETQEVWLGTMGHSVLDNRQG